MPRPRKDYTGERHGHLVIQETVGYNKNGRPLVRCLCDCGREVARDYYNLGPKSSCSNWDHEKLGKRFGRLVVEDYDHTDAGGNVLFRCRCDCGNEKIVKGIALANGHAKSCGCLGYESRARNLAHHRSHVHVDGTDLDKLTSKPQANNTSGVRGVCFHRRKGLWQAYIRFAKHHYSLGYYKSLEEAAQARRKAEQMIFDPVLVSHGKDPTDDVEWRQRIAESLNSFRKRNRGIGMTAIEAAEAAHVSRNAITRALKCGLLKGTKVGNRWSIDPESLEEWMRTRSGA